jgi:hypothetical protein
LKVLRRVNYSTKEAAMPNKRSRLLLTVLGGSASFNPLTIPGLALWLDASDSTTLFQASNGTTPAAADNDVVGYWGDKSGNTRHETQGTTANKPTVQLSEQNGLSAIQFDGTDDYMDSPNFGADIAQPTTIFLVADAPAKAQYMWYDSTVSRQVMFKQPGAAGHTVFAGSLVAATNTTTYAVKVWTARYNGASSFLRLNGTQIATGNAGANVLRQVRIGWSNTLSATYEFPGKMCELLAYPSITDAQMLTIEAYLTAKWGIV